MKKIILTLTAIFAFQNTVHAAEILKDFDSLGGNSEIYEKASALNPEIKTQIIQNRIVDRRMRFEVAPSYTTYWGGNPYISSQSAGLDVHFHINPRFSIGLAYNFQFFNEVTSEGDWLIQNEIVPDVDYPEGSILGKLTYYPFYGKLNLFNNIVHFDIYGSVGGGTTQLRFGNQTTLTADFGMGIWWSQHLTTRIGYQFQTYEAQLKNGSDRLNISSGLISVGYLL